MPKMGALLLLGIGACAAVVATRASPANDSAACAGDSPTRQLDYWLGDWTLSSGGSSNSTSRVYLMLDRCLFVEHWDDGQGHSGENLFAYSAGDRSWRGLFADNKGHVHVFVDGTVSDGSAEFLGPSRGPNGETVLNRIRLLRVAGRDVEQTWEKSVDQGSTWTRQFQLHYSRKLR
jgi:hypothetical protein